MIFPNKYLKFNNSLINLGAMVIKIMKKNTWYSVDEIWRAIKLEKNVKQFTFNDCLLTFDFLYSLNTIKMNDKGEICLN